MTEVEAHKVFAVLCSLFPTAKTEPWERRDENGRLVPIPGGGTRGAYARMLADLEYPAACAAVERTAATHRFPHLPSVAEIRDAYAELTRGAVRAGGDAWGDVQALHSPTSKRPGCSVYRHPRPEDVEDPVTWRCIQQLGWVSLCNSENPVSDRAQFIALYDKLAASDRREAVTATLPAATRLRELAAGKVAELAGAIGGGARRLGGGS